MWCRRRHRWRFFFFFVLLEKLYSVVIIYLYFLPIISHSNKTQGLLPCIHVSVWEHVSETLKTFQSECCTQILQRIKACLLIFYATFFQRERSAGIVRRCATACGIKQKADMKTEVSSGVNCGIYCMFILLQKNLKSFYLHVKEVNTRNISLSVSSLIIVQFPWSFLNFIIEKS